MKKCHISVLWKEQKRVTNIKFIWPHLDCFKYSKNTSSLFQSHMNLPPDKLKLLSQYDNEKKWELVCDQVRSRSFIYPFIFASSSSKQTGFLQRCLHWDRVDTKYINTQNGSRGDEQGAVWKPCSSFCGCNRWRRWHGNRGRSLSAVFTKTEQ